jgi:hypothetical protein
MPERKGIWEEIQALFTGYGKKENLREADKKLRETYTADLGEARRKWEGVLKAALDNNQGVEDARKAMNLMDRLANKVEHADYGYAAWSDRKGSIREEDLKKAFDYDQGLGQDLEAIKATAGQVYADCENSNFGLLVENAKKVKNALVEFEGKWDDREKAFGREF